MASVTSPQKTAPAHGVGGEGNRKKTDELFSRDAGSGEMIFATMDDFQLYAKLSTMNWEAGRSQNKKHDAAKPCLQLYKGYVYDITEFTGFHPGGASVLDENHGSDITRVFHGADDSHMHTNKALHMMLQYRVGRVDDLVNTSHDSYDDQPAYPCITEKEIAYADFTLRRDRGVVWQAIYLTLPQFYHFTSTPLVLQDMLLFDSPLLELFTRTKFWVVVVLWMPLVVFLMVRGVFSDYSQVPTSHVYWMDRYLYYPNRHWLFSNYPAPASGEQSMYGNYSWSSKIAVDTKYVQAVNTSQFSVYAVASLFAVGVFSWTLLEYLLHRFVFHMERSLPTSMADTPVFKTTHLLAHGLHHVIPMDPDRLVLPPAMFAIFYLLLRYLFCCVLGGSLMDILGAGMVMGYIAYDMVHFFIHHCPWKSRYMRAVRRVHHLHHYTSDEKGFGVTSSLWDIVFGTAFD